MSTLCRTRCSAPVVAALAIVACALAGAQARAETVVEAWRTPYGRIATASVNSVGGSIWAISGASLIHVTAEGSLLFQSTPVPRPTALAADSSDGTVWVILGGMDSHGLPSTTAELVHLSSDGRELWRSTLASGGLDLGVSPSDGKLWVENGEYLLVHVTVDGVVLWQSTEPVYDMAVDEHDGSCWAVLLYDDVAHYSAANAEVGRNTTVPYTMQVRVDPSDDSCWVDSGAQLVHLAYVLRKYPSAGQDNDLHSLSSQNGTGPHASRVSLSRHQSPGAIQ
jgi:hypothetical protein